MKKEAKEEMEVKEVKEVKEEVGKDAAVELALEVFFNPSSYFGLYFLFSGSARLGNIP